MKQSTISFVQLLAHTRPAAVAEIRGNTGNPKLHGSALFYPPTAGGVLILAEVFHLPDESLPNTSGFFGMHIHEFGDCTVPFDKTGEHYNPGNHQHPDHAGDLPPLLSNSGYAWMAFYDDRFSLDDLVGKSIVIHGGKDDFTSQPSGHSGDKIGCGVIERI